MYAETYNIGFPFQNIFQAEAFTIQRTPEEPILEDSSINIECEITEVHITSS